MASGNPTQDGSALHATRQMLDELDALMERMLALPVNDLDDAPPAPRAPVRTATLSATLTVLDPSAGAGPSPLSTSVTVSTVPAETALAAPPQPPPPYNPPHFLTLPTSAPPAAAWPGPPSPPAPAPVPAPFGPRPEPLTPDVIPPTVLSEIQPLLADIPDHTPGVEAWLAAPLIWANQLFDAAAEAVLGQGGLWLQTRGGRAVLGVAGIGMGLLAAGLWAKDALGWTW